MKKIKRPSKYDELILATCQNNSHLHSAAVRANRDLLQFEMGQVEDRILALNNALASSRERCRVIQAQIVGLGLVLEKR